MSFLRGKNIRLLHIGAKHLIGMIADSKHSKLLYISMTNTRNRSRIFVFTYHNISYF